MKYSKNIKIINKIKVCVLILFLIPSLYSCSARTGKFWDPADAREVDVSGDVRARQAIEEGRAPSAMGMLKGTRGGMSEFASSNVLWRASLEILDFLPLANVDYSGGLIITDWYSDSTTADESLKITVRFLSNEIRAEGIEVSIHERICDTNRINCKIVKKKSKLENEIKLAILRKAALIQTSDRKKMRKKNKGKYRPSQPKKEMTKVKKKN